MIKKIIYLFSSIKLLFITLIIIFSSLLLNLFLNFIDIDNTKLIIIINFLNLNEVYNTWWFKSFITILVINIMSCMSIRLINFINQIKKQNININALTLSPMTKIIETKSINVNKIINFLKKLNYKLYKIINNESSIIVYSFKGIFGKIGFFSLHFLIVIILLLFTLSSIFETFYYIDLYSNESFKIPYSNIIINLKDIKTQKQIFAELLISEINTNYKEIKIIKGKDYKINDTYYRLNFIDFDVFLKIKIEDDNKNPSFYYFKEGDYIFLNQDSVIYINKVNLEKGLNNVEISLVVKGNSNIENIVLNKKNNSLILNNYLITFDSLLSYLRLKISLNKFSILIFISFFILIVSVFLSLYISFDEIYVIIGNNIILIGKSNKMNKKIKLEIEKLKNYIEEEIDE